MTLTDDNINGRGLLHVNGADLRSMKLTDLRESFPFFLARSALYDHKSDAAEGARIDLSIDDAEPIHAASD